MAGISTSISVTDRMSSVINRINSSLERLIGTMEETGEESERMLDEGVPAQEQYNDSLEAGTIAAGNLAGALAGVLSVATAVAAVKFAVSSVQELLEAADTQNQAETQLATVLSNMGYSLDTFNEVKDMASEMQANSIYGDEAYLAGAAELATYVTDAEALKTVLGTLPDFATGMANGAELDAEGMVDIATQLGKVFNGTYDGIAKKGFVLTDQQKDIIENGTDMEKALVISDIVNESWDNLAENMANTPSGAVTQLANAWGDVKEVIGNELYPSVSMLANTIKENLPTIMQLMQGAEYILESLVNGVNTLFTNIAIGFQNTGDNIQAAENALAILGATFTTIFATLYDILVPFINFFANVWTDPIDSILRAFGDLITTMLELLQILAGSMDAVFGSHIATGIQGWQDQIESAFDDVLGERKIDVKSIELEDALAAGASWGMGLADSFTTPTFSTYDAGYLLSDISTDTEEIAETVTSSSDEIIKYMKDIAERDAVNQFTTAEVKVELGGVTNNVTGTQDLDGFTQMLSSALSEAIAVTAAGDY